MSELISLQQAVLKASPGLMPLMAIAYSFLNSWHCSLMCGPMLTAESRARLHRLFLFRLFGYTAVGAAFGFAGRWLGESLEFRAFAGIAFAVFTVLTFVFVLPQLIPALPKASPRRLLGRLADLKWPVPLRGLFFALLPCHLLAFYYGLATLTRSPLAGGALLFGHAVMTTPALAYSWRASGRIKTWSQPVQIVLRWVLVGLVIFNLLFFAGHLFHPAEDVIHRPLFCW